MKTVTFTKDWPVRLNERQDTTYLAAVSYSLDSDMERRARAAGVLADDPVGDAFPTKAKAKRAP